MSNITAAGFIIIRQFKGSIQYLGLIALEKDRKRAKGVYDVPKGRLDPGEDQKTAAFRECEEEAGFKPKLSDVLYTTVTNGKLKLWIADVEPNVKIRLNPNPQTGKMEHEGYEWMSYEKMVSNCLIYLRPLIIRAQILIEDSYNL